MGDATGRRRVEGMEEWSRDGVTAESLALRG